MTISFNSHGKVIYLVIVMFLWVYILLFDASVEFSICKKLLCMFSILNITPFNFSVTVVGYCAFWFGGEKGRIIYHDDRLGICKWVYLADFVEG